MNDLKPSRRAFVTSISLLAASAASGAAKPNWGLRMRASATSIGTSPRASTYSPFEGWRIAFNGTGGRIEASQNAPYFENLSVDQAELHAAEMAQRGEEDLESNAVILHKLWKEHEVIEARSERGGHGGGDKRLHDQIFKHPEREDPYGRAAGVRDRALSVVIGIAERKSIESGKPVPVASLTDLQPRSVRIV